MLGQVLIIAGVFFIWSAWKGKARPIWNAITGDTNFSTKLDGLANAIGPLSSSGGGSGGGKSGGSGSSNQPDSGTHMGIDSSGNIVTIDKPYGSMTNAEKDAANNFAHQIGNVG